MSAVLLMLLGLAGQAEEKASLPKIPLAEITAIKEIFIPGFQGIDFDPLSLREKTVVLVFVGLECPVANAYAPEILAQMNAAKDKELVWLAVHSEPGVTKDAATKHAEEYKLSLPILLDSEQKLAAAVGAKKLGQVVVLQDLQVVYRGRIDDRFATNGKRRDEPSTHELRDTLIALAAKKPVPVAEAEAYGCPIPFKK